MVHKYSGILLNQKKEYNNAICRNMGASRVYHTKWNMSEKDTVYHLCVESKYDTNELIFET